MVVKMELEWGRLAVWDSVGGFGVKTGRKRAVARWGFAEGDEVIANMEGDETEWVAG
jgi:hypothetical protein